MPSLSSSSSSLSLLSFSLGDVWFDLNAVGDSSDALYISISSKEFIAAFSSDFNFFLPFFDGFFLCTVNFKNLFIRKIIFGG